VPEIRVDPLTGQRTVVAGERATRPGAGLRTTPAEPIDPATDPFLEGHEDRTPPEVFAVRPGGGAPDTPGWTVRVVPNLYPVFEHHEVVISTPRHVRSFAQLNENEVDGVATAWRERAAAARGAGFPYMHALLNEGREAGASLPHTHTQLVWLADPPPAVEAESRGDGCAVCTHVQAELDSGDRVVLEQDGLVLLASYGGRLPYELLLAPVEHTKGSAFESELLSAALALMAESLRRVQALAGPLPLNAWLHDREHWHLEVVPRLTVFAGIELGAGIYVNSIAPETAAAELRALSG
jgi:UDPglucose--hexose-1-phosphate uridylyltransferase